MQCFQKPIKWHSPQPYSVNTILIHCVRGRSPQDYMHRLYLASPVLSHTLHFRSCTQVRLLVDVLVTPLSWFHLPGSWVSCDTLKYKVIRSQENVTKKMAFLSQKAFKLLQETPWDFAHIASVTPFTRNPPFWLEAGCLFKLSIKLPRRGVTHSGHPLKVLGQPLTWTTSLKQDHPGGEEGQAHHWKLRIVSAHFFIKQKLKKSRNFRILLESDTGQILAQLWLICWYKLNNSNCRKLTSELITPFVVLSWAQSRKCPSVSSVQFAQEGSFQQTFYWAFLPSRTSLKLKLCLWHGSSFLVNMDISCWKTDHLYTLERSEVSDIPVWAHFTPHCSLLLVLCFSSLLIHIFYLYLFLILR